MLILKEAKQLIKMKRDSQASYPKMTLSLNLQNRLAIFQLFSKVVMKALIVESTTSGFLLSITSH